MSCFVLVETLRALRAAVFWQSWGVWVYLICACVWLRVFCVAQGGFSVTVVTRGVATNNCHNEMLLIQTVFTTFAPSTQHIHHHTPNIQPIHQTYHPYNPHTRNALAKLPTPVSSTRLRSAVNRVRAPVQQIICASRHNCDGMMVNVCE